MMCPGDMALGQTSMTDSSQPALGFSPAHREETTLKKVGYLMLLATVSLMIMITGLIALDAILNAIQH